MTKSMQSVEPLPPAVAHVIAQLNGRPFRTFPLKSEGPSKCICWPFVCGHTGFTVRGFRKCFNELTRASWLVD